MDADRCVVLSASSRLEAGFYTTPGNVIIHLRSSKLGPRTVFHLEGIHGSNAPGCTIPETFNLKVLRGWLQECDEVTTSTAGDPIALVPEGAALRVVDVLRDRLEVLQKYLQYVALSYA